MITTLFAEGCGLHVSQKADKSLTYSDSWREAGLPGIKIITKITAQSFSCVGAARKVFPDRSQKTMTCHFFLIVLVLFGVRVRHHWWLLFRADATWPQSLVCKPETPSQDVIFFSFENSSSVLPPFWTEISGQRLNTALKTSIFSLQEMLELVKNYHKVSDDDTSALSWHSKEINSFFTFRSIKSSRFEIVASISFQHLYNVLGGV